MPTSEPQRSAEELARLGTETFQRSVRPRLRPEDVDKFVAIDVDTGEYELDANDFSAIARLRARQPQAEIWLERVGQPTAYKLRHGR
jgi:hypothetical protein